MFLSVYKENETNFDSQGEFKINVPEQDAVIYRELNGFFYATFRLANDARNKRMLKMRQIIKLPTLNKKNPWQLFRITEELEDLKETIYTAYHISYDLAINFIPDINIVGQTRKQAAEYIINNSAERNNFSIIDKEDPKIQKNLRIVRKHTLNSLMGSDDNTLKKRYGCEFDFDNFNIIIADQIGEKTNYLIKDNKNISEYEKATDYKTIATRIIPQGGDELLLPEYHIDSPLIGVYDQIYYKHIVFDDIRVTPEGEEVDGESITREMALELLRNAVKKLYDNHIDEPFINFTLTLDDLQNDPDYKHLRQFLKLDIGDEILLRKKGFNGDIHTRILSYKYNFYSNSFEELTLSNIIQDFTITVDKIVDQIQWNINNFKVQISNMDESFKASLEILEDSITQEVSKEVSKVKIGGANILNFTNYENKTIDNIIKADGWQKPTKANARLVKYSHSNNNVLDKFIKDKNILDINFVVSEEISQGFLNPRGINLNGNNTTEYIELKPNSTYTFSGYIYPGGDGTNGVYFALWGYDDDGSNRDLIKEYDIINWTGYFQRLEITFNTDDRKFYQTRIYINSKGAAAYGKTASAFFYNLKLEEGTKATAYLNSDWDKTSYTNEKVEDAKATIKLETDKITQSVITLEKENVTIKSDLEEKAIKADVYTKKETESKIETAKKEINLSVSESYETKVNVESKINDIKIGAENLLLATDYSRFNVEDIFPSKWQKPSKLDAKIVKYQHSNNNPIDNFIKDKNVLNLSYNVAEGITQCYFNPCGQNINGQETAEYIELKSNTEYVLSCWLYVGGGNATNGVTFIVWGYDDDGGNRTKLIGSDHGFEWTGYFQFLEFKFKTDNRKFYQLRFYLNSKGLDYIGQSVSNNFYNLKLEKGNKATDYSPAPEEIYEYTTSYTLEEVAKAKADIKVTTDSITQNVSKLESVTYSGSGNLVPNSNWKKGPIGWKLSNDYNGNYAYGISGATSLKEDKNYIRIGNTTNNNYDVLFIDSPKFAIAAGETITAGAYCGRNTNLTAQMYILFTDNIEDITINNSYFQGYKSIVFDSTGYQKKILTDTAPSGATRAFIRLRISKVDKNINTDSSSTWAGLMVVRGSTALPWTPNQEDGFLYTSEKVAEIKVTTDEIKSSVSKVESDAANKYATKSSLTQTADSITAKFESSGGFNILKNSRPKNSLYGWDYSNGTGNTSNLTLTAGTEIWNGERFNSGIWWKGNKTTTNWSNITNKSLTDDKFKFSTIKNYVVRFPIYSDTENKKLFVRISDKDSNNVVNNYNFTTIKGYKMVEYTFKPTTPGNTPDFMIFLESTGSYSFFIPWVMLCEGSNEKTPWSGAAGEAYAGITEINADGIKVSHSGTGNFSYMSADGFARYVSNSKKMYHYLMTTGTANVRDGQDATITLPNDFKGKDFQVTVGAFKINIVSGWDSIYDIDSFVTGKNTTNGTFSIRGMVKSNNQLQGSLDVSYIVIA